MIKYLNKKEIVYLSRYGKTVTVPKNYPSDGATGAFDIRGKHPAHRIKDSKTIQTSRGFWVHDALCDRGTFDDGTPCTNRQASQILSDILREEKRYIRCVTWFVMTHLFGGGKCRDNK